MKKHMLLSGVCLTLTMILVATGSAQAGSRYSIGLRQHNDHSVAEDIPYGDNDLSYGVSYEVHDAGGWWQFALNYSDDLTPRKNIDTNEVTTVETVFTPEVNLIMKDNYWLAGIGVLMSYVEEEDLEGETNEEWTDLYYQFLLGFDIQLARSLELELLAYYPFQDWGDLGDFDFDDIDIGGWISYRF